MIRFQGVSKIYPGPIEAVKDVSLEIKPREFVCLVGPSGAGKTTLIKLLIREEEVTRGKIFVKNQDITQFTYKDLPQLRRQIGIVFQDCKLLPEKNAYENIAFAMEMCGFPTSQIREDVPRVLKIVGLSGKALNFPHELSGGEKQRVALARALIHRPDILVADEPTGNLDPFNTWEIIKLLTKINELGTTVILATHDTEIIETLKSRTVSLQKGRIVKDETEGKYII